MPWLRNVADEDPAVTLHLKGQLAVADVEGTARVVTEAVERRALIEGVARNWNRTDVDVRWSRHSPLMEVMVPGYPG